ncbi:Mov34/MPN/PAD-1 family protein [candidate division WOR-3 bacterium]|nr:Mov34/MPN/PAD-1 family protein [candidate division WOR-3 bacterium]
MVDLVYNFHVEEFNVYIKERAFLAMILSVIEVYKRETLGLLLGHRGENKFVIEYAIPSQTAERMFSWSEPKTSAIERMTEIIENMPINVIGDYHSHTEFRGDRARAVPSGEDIADMRMGNVHIIIAVNQKSKSKRWRQNKDGTISGTLSDYHIKISAATPISDYKFKPVRIICPSATGIFD